MPKHTIMVEWRCYTSVEVEANCMKDAIDKVENVDVPTPYPSILDLHQEVDWEASADATKENHGEKNSKAIA